MTKVAKLRALLRERPNGFVPINDIIDAKQIDFLSRERIFYESSDLQCLISKGKTSKDGLRVVLLENQHLALSKVLHRKVFQLQTGLQIKHFADEDTVLDNQDEWIPRRLE